MDYRNIVVMFNALILLSSFLLLLLAAYYSDSDNYTIVSVHIFVCSLLLASVVVAFFNRKLIKLKYAGIKTEGTVQDSILVRKSFGRSPEYLLEYTFQDKKEVTHKGKIHVSFDVVPPKKDEKITIFYQQNKLGNNFPESCTHKLITENRKMLFIMMFCVTCFSFPLAVFGARG